MCFFLICRDLDIGGFSDFWVGFSDCRLFDMFGGFSDSFFAGFQNVPIMELLICMVKGKGYINKSIIYLPVHKIEIGRKKRGDA